MALWWGKIGYISLCLLIILTFTLLVKGGVIVLYCSLLKEEWKGQESFRKIKSREFYNNMRGHCKNLPTVSGAQMV